MPPIITAAMSGRLISGSCAHGVMLSARSPKPALLNADRLWKKP